jgi:hypothetical protein
MPVYGTIGGLHPKSGSSTPWPRRATCSGSRGSSPTSRWPRRAPGHQAWWAASRPNAGPAAAKSGIPDLEPKYFSGKPSIWVSPFVSRANHPPGPVWLAKEGLATESGSRTLPGGSNAQDDRCNEDLDRWEDRGPRGLRRLGRCGVGRFRSEAKP